MKIGYDAKRAIQNFTGLGNYSRFVIESIARECPENQLLLYAPKVRENARMKPILELDNVELRTPASVFGRKMGSLWRSGMGITRQMHADGINLYHGLSNELPLNIASSGIPSVVTIHDVIYRRVPQDYSAIDRRLYDFKYGRSARNATRIIAISECTRRDLINDYNIPEDKIDVVYQGCHEIFSAEPSTLHLEEVKRKYSLPERFIAMVGTVQSRKNQLLAVKALRGLDSDVKLTIVGRRTSPYADEIDRYIASNSLSDRIIWIEGATLAEIAAIYHLATLAAYPSRYEGFGLPVVEAISTGTPVIAATGSCLEEAGGPGALYVNPDSDEQFIHEASRLLSDSDLRASMAVAGAVHIQKFSNSTFAAQTLQTYRRALAGY